MEKTVEQPALTTAEVEALREIVRNMTEQEQTVVVSVLDSSIMESELSARRAIMGGAVRNMANEIRKVDIAWAR